MPRNGKGHANECSADEIEPLYEQLITPVKFGTAAKSISPESTPTPKKRQSWSEEIKLEAATQYSTWLKLGSPPKFHPGKAFADAYGCHDRFVQHCYDELLTTGSVKKKLAGNVGVKRKFGDELDDAIATVVREKRAVKRRAACRVVAREVAVPGKENQPSKSTVNERMKAMGYKIHRCKKKPLLTKTQREARLEFAIEYCDTAMLRTVVYDEKWFEEPKVSGEFHARDGSPVKDTDRFTTMTWETATQRQKVMYLAAISETEKIGLWEVDFADKSNVRKDGKPGKGLTAGLLVKYLKLMKKEAIKKLGPGVRMCMCMRMRMCMGTSPFVKIHFLW